MKGWEIEACEDRNVFPAAGYAQVDTTGLIASRPRHDLEATLAAVLAAPHASLTDPLFDPATSLGTSAAMERCDTRGTAACPGLSSPCLVMWRRQRRGNATGRNPGQERSKARPQDGRTPSSKIKRGYFS